MKLTKKQVKKNRAVADATGHPVTEDGLITMDAAEKLLHRNDMINGYRINRDGVGIGPMSTISIINRAISERGGGQYWLEKVCGPHFY